jgi:hypothetical protein
LKAVERQNVVWWDDLKEQVQKRRIGDNLVERFADYLAGYALVREFDIISETDPKQPGRVTPFWRKAKRQVEKLQTKGLDIGSSVSLHYPGREHLRTTLIAKMEDELVASATGWKRQFCGRTITELWRLVGEEISSKSNPDDRDATVARRNRRSRKRSKP